MLFPCFFISSVRTGVESRMGEWEWRVDPMSGPEALRSGGAMQRNASGERLGKAMKYGENINKIIFIISIDDNNIGKYGKI